MFDHVVHDVAEAYSRGWEVLGTVGLRALGKVTDDGVVSKPVLPRKTYGREHLQILVRRSEAHREYELGAFHGGVFKAEAKLLPKLDGEGEPRSYVGVAKNVQYTVVPNPYAMPPGDSTWLTCPDVEDCPWDVDFLEDLIDDGYDLRDEPNFALSQDPIIAIGIEEPDAESIEEIGILDESDPEDEQRSWKRFILELLPWSRGESSKGSNSK